MDVKDAFDDLMDRDDVNLYLHEARGLVDASSNILFRDREVEMLLKEIALVRNGSTRYVGITGQGGTGKSFVMKNLYSIVKQKMPELHSKLIRTDHSRKHVIQNFLMMFTGVPDFDLNIPDMKEMILRELKDKRMILFVDDYDNLEYRFKRDVLDIVKGGNVSMFSTMDESWDPTPFWHNVVKLPAFTMPQLMEISKNLMEKNVKTEVLGDDLPIELCASHVTKNFDSNIKAVIRILELSIDALENDRLFNDRIDCALTMKDVQKAIFNYAGELKHGIEVNLKKNLTSSLVLAILSMKNGQTLETIYTILDRVMRTIFPGKRIPAMATVGNALRRLSMSSIVNAERISNGKGAGVTVKWWAKPSGDYDLNNVMSNVLIKSMTKIMGEMK